ncbi:MAG: hypothetical protein JWQ90_5316 [Hydrocarboniphaga sp.]|uniref:hypothetical protein n=1 Tax=Hydrocarboniphaga sp. TaxID=2033016 RepID=UPI00261A7D76|nr:hypothetical protein [Hydrocarboniphaga sp.]MDB5972866.1 hypothetical protein [Hydrocarboniphaga sp.]
MKIRFPLLVAASLLATTVQPALADCVTQVKQIEPQVSAVTNAAKKEQAQKQITLAVEQADKGDEKGCQKLLGQAKKVSGVKDA